MRSAITWACCRPGSGGAIAHALAVVAVAAVAFGWQHRRSLAGVLWVGFAPAVVVLVGELLFR